MPVFAILNVSTTRNGLLGAVQTAAAVAEPTVTLSTDKDVYVTGELTAPAIEGQYTLTAQFNYNENGTNKILIQTTTVHTKIDVHIPEFASIALVGGLLFMRRKED